MPGANSIAATRNAPYVVFMLILLAEVPCSSCREFLIAATQAARSFDVLAMPSPRRCVAREQGRLPEGTCFMHWAIAPPCHGWRHPSQTQFYDRPNERSTVFSRSKRSISSLSVHQAFNHKNTMEFLTPPVLVNPNDAMESVHMVRKSHPNMLDGNQIVKKTKFKEGV